MYIENTNRINPDLNSMRECRWDSKTRRIIFDPDKHKVSFGFLYKEEYYRFTFDPSIVNAEFEDTYPSITMTANGKLRVYSSVKYESPVRTKKPDVVNFLHKPK